MPFLDLPNELLLAISDQAASVTSIASLVRTCRRFHNVFKLPLYLQNFQVEPEWWYVHKRDDDDWKNPSRDFSKLQASISNKSELGADFAFYNQMDCRSCSHALYYATRWSHTQIIAFLFEINVRFPTYVWEYAFQLSIYNGNVDVARLFIEHGEDVDQEIPIPCYPGSDLHWECKSLHLACGRGNPRLVSLLLEKGADVEARDFRKRTPLHWALMPVDYGYPPSYEPGDLIGTVKVLLQHGANIKAEGWVDVHRPIDYARSYPDIAFLGLLKIHTLKESDADYLENILQDQLNAPGSWTRRERERHWKDYIAQREQELGSS